EEACPTSGESSRTRTVGEGPSGRSRGDHPGYGGRARSTPASDRGQTLPRTGSVRTGRSVRATPQRSGGRRPAVLRPERSSGGLRRSSSEYALRSVESVRRDMRSALGPSWLPRGEESRRKFTTPGMFGRPIRRALLRISRAGRGGRALGQAIGRSRVVFSNASENSRPQRITGHARRQIRRLQFVAARRGKERVMSNEKSKALNVPDNQSAEAALRLPKEPDVSHPNHCCVHQYWAVVETDGTLVRGRNVKYSKYLGTPGQYEVAFTGDISRGVYVAMIGRPGSATEPAGEIGVALR